MISFIEDDKKFNFRVGAVIVNSDKTKVLLNTIKGFGFYVLPGGRVEWNETTSNAIIRELEEEIGLKDINPMPIAFIENFFNFMNYDYHEISKNFVIYLDDRHKDIEKSDDFFGLEGEKHIYKWVKFEDLDTVTLKPAMLKKLILDRENNVRFYELKNNEEIEN